MSLKTDSQSVKDITVKDLITCPLCGSSLVHLILEIKDERVPRTRNKNENSKNKARVVAVAEISKRQKEECADKGSGKRNGSKIRKTTR